VDYKSRENKKDMQIYSDFIVLSTSIVPKENEELIRILRVNRDKNRFLASAHENLRPLDSPTEGIFFCGCIGGPVSVEESIIQGSCVAMRVGTLLSGETVETFSIAAQIDEDKCIGCGYCTEVCTANVIVLEDKEMIVNERIEKDGRPDTIKVKKARIIEANCRACYKCVVQCPVHAIYAPYFTFPQIIEMIKKSIKH
ncbi:MAG: 4Fe-4S binding protein, partial [Candidatus Helarchaeota archaeon]